jgi:HEAT repeat protein
VPIKKSEDKGNKPKGEKRIAKREFEDLLIQLSSPLSTERRWGARDLAEFPEASSYLLDQLKKENDISVQEVIISSLIKIGDDIAIKGLINLLKSEDAHLRNAAIEALQNVPEKVSAYIEKLLHDNNSDVRIFTVNILESLRHPNVIKWLIEVLENDKNINVCATALDLLAEVGTKEALPAIKKVKERFSDEPYIQFAADLALRRIDGEE